MHGELLGINVALAKVSTSCSGSSKASISLSRTAFAFWLRGFMGMGFLSRLVGNWVRLLGLFIGLRLEFNVKEGRQGIYQKLF